MKSNTRYLLILFNILFFSISGISNNDPFSLKFDENLTTKERITQINEFFDAYYEENYFSKGFKKTEMSGTGYYPYQRAKWFYEMRAIKNGEIPYLKRWSVFEKSKNHHLATNSLKYTANWQNFGPTNNGGRTISHAFDPTDSQIIWAGSAAGGLWRSPDGGDTWEPTTDNLPSLSIGAMAINPQDPNVMLIGTGEGYGFLYEVNGVGILKSVDRGLTWNQTSFSYLQNQGVCCFSIVWDPVNTQNIYLACTNGFWKSTDMGETWNKILTGRATAAVINKKSPNIIYTVLQGSGFYKSIDYGNTWQHVTTGLPGASQIGFTSLAICDSFPNILYAGIAENSYPSGIQGFYKSNDSGESWTLIPTTPNFYCYTPPNQNVCQGWYDNVTAVSPVDSNIVFANGINLYKSIDGGINWTTPGGSLPNPFVHVDHHSFGFDPQNPNVVYSFNDGGIYKSYDLGENWEEKNDGYVTFQFYSISSAMTDTNIVTGGSQDNCTQIVNSANNNKEWNIWWYGDGMVCNIDYTDANIMYGEGNNGYHGKTTDGGNSSYPINTGITELGPWVTPVIMNPIDPNILFTVSNSKIYKTMNGGLQWSSVATIANCKVLEIDQINPDVVYACTYIFSTRDFNLWRSADAGSSWVQASLPGWRVTDLTASPVSEGVLYATQNTFDGLPRIFKSTDYGDNWINITNDLPDVGLNAIAINPYAPEHLYVATDLGVYLSTTDGDEWQEFNDGLPNVYTLDIHIHPADTTVRIGTFGRGYWKTKAVPFSVSSLNKSESGQTIADFELCNSYPNPFNMSTNIEYKINRKNKVSIRIYNETGQLIKKLFSGYQNSGKYTKEWDGKNSNGLTVSSGLYYVQLVVNNVSQYKKIMLLK